MSSKVAEIDQILGRWKTVDEEGDRSIYSLLSGMDAHDLRLIGGNSSLQENMVHTYSKNDDTYVFKLCSNNVNLVKEEYELGHEIVHKEMSGLRLWTMTMTYENGEVIHRRQAQDNGEVVTSYIKVTDDILTKVTKAGQKSMKHTLVRITDDAPIKVT